MSMSAPPDMPPFRPSRSCADCVHSDSGAAVLRCTYGAMVSKAEDNRSLRGLCGVRGNMWRPKYANT